MLSRDSAPPVDRPNLSKDYLAGSAPEEWVPLRPDDFYADNRIDLRLATEVAAIAREGARSHDRGRQAASPMTGCCSRPAPSRCVCRSRAPISRMCTRCARSPTAAPSSTCAKSARRAVVIGASFIGLEAAASLRARGIEVHVVAPEAVPMERVLGREMGEFVRALHEEHGVVFHLRRHRHRDRRQAATLKSGGTLDADLVVVGVGVRPRLALAEQAGLAIDRGVTVNAFLETSAPGIYAAGDIARWPDAHTGRQHPRRALGGCGAPRTDRCAPTCSGLSERFDAVPFFWSQHYDVPINYVGHAEQWDEIAIEGDIKAKDCLLRYKKGGRVLAVASIFRDVDSLKAELAMERDAAA